MSNSTKNETSYYAFDTSSYEEGTILQWRVRTAGATIKWGDWSVKRTVDIHAQPTLKLSVKNNPRDPNAISEITTFPFHIIAIPGPATQAPIGYHISITSNEAYETADRMGNPITVNIGDEVYSRFFDIDYDLDVEMTAADVDLERNVSYTITVTVTMDSGLNASESVTLPVTWSELVYSPNAEIRVDADDYTAYIRPYCEDTALTCYEVSKIGSTYLRTNTDLGFVSRSKIFYEVIYSRGVYSPTTNIIECAPGTPLADVYVNESEQVYVSVDDYGNTVCYYSVDPAAGAYTTTGEQVFYGVDSYGNAVYFAEVEVSTEVDDVTFSVYRREFDGSFTEIATEIKPGATVTDPHPALDFARYRIIAISKETGSVGYYDMPGYPVGGKEVIIQWNEAWTNFEVEEDVEMAEPPWSGSLLKLPYNIDVTDNHNPDVSLIEYIGRSHPVSYYGTHLGESSTWNVEIDKQDKETLYALRRLAKWMGDAYVREPSGSSYWANVVVGFSQKHCEVTIPVTLSIKRVEGGM